MVDLTFNGGVADAPYVPPPGWSSLYDGFRYFDPASIKTAQNNFGVLLEDSQTSGDLIVTEVFTIHDSGGAGHGPCFLTAAGGGFASRILGSSDYFDLVWIVGGSDTTIFASGAISDFLSFDDGDTMAASLRYNSSGNLATLALNGVQLASAIYSGGVTALRGGIQAYNNQFEKIISVSVSDANAPVAESGFGFIENIQLVGFIS